MNVKDLNPSFSRRPEEMEKFKCLIQTLVWAQDKTGKSSAEIIRLTLRKGKTLLDRYY